MKTRSGGNGEVLGRLPCASRLLVADADDLGAGMLEGHAQQVAHVHVVEVDAGDLPLPTHAGISVLLKRSPSWRTR